MMERTAEKYKRGLAKLERTRSINVDPLTQIKELNFEDDP